MNQSATFDEVGFETLSAISQANKFNKWMYETIKPYLKGNILEIGSGIGNISQFVVSDNYSITLSDYDAAYYEYLKKQFLVFKNVQTVLQIDLQHPNFTNEYAYLKEKFDTIFFLNVIEHLKDDSVAVQNCKFLLKENGCVIILAPAYQWLFCNFDENLGHYRRYTKHSLKHLIKKNGFRIQSSEYFNFLGIIGWLIYGKIFQRKMIQKNELSAYNKLVGVAKWMDKVLMKRIGLSAIVAAIKI